jgi:hypothetical membrane protein
VGTAGYLVAGTLQPTSYSPVRDTVSVLAGYAGADRWLMTSALFLVGGCYLLTAAGLAGARRFARILLVVAGVAVIGIATSPEPAAGPTVRHLAWTVLGAVTIAVWPLFTARRGSPRPLLLSVRGSIAVTIVFIGLVCWFLAEAQGGSTLGLAERVTTSVEAMWPFAVALTLRRTGPGRGSDRGRTDRLPDRLGWRTLGGRDGPRTLPHLAVGPDELVQPHRIRGLAPALPGQAVSRHRTGLSPAAVGNE